MNLSRLMILGVLAERGPMHGHQIRRIAELTNAGAWGGITGGALYAELRKLDGEGLVEAVREEQMGRRPARTVYEITGEGRLELVVQRDAALEVIFGSADPLSVVLLFAAGADRAELSQRLTDRRQKIAARRDGSRARPPHRAWRPDRPRRCRVPPGRAAPGCGAALARGVRAARIRRPGAVTQRGGVAV